MRGPPYAMADYVLTEQARQDFRDIYRYSLKRWGEAQADKYTSGLLDQFDMLATFPGMGLPFYKPSYGLLKFPYEYHMIAYRIFDEATIQVVFVIHGQIFIPEEIARRVDRD